MAQEVKNERRALTYEQQKEAERLIRENSTMVEGFIVYAKGWNDEQVASTIGDGVNTQQIGRFRARHIGNVRLVEAAKKPPTDSDALLSMIAELKADVERLNKALRNVAVEGNFERAYRILESQN